MYKVLCDGALMYDPRYEELALINPVVKLEENKAGSFSFKILPNHPLYDAIKRRKSVIQVLQDEDIIFAGLCVGEKKDFYNQKTVSCEGELAYLNDSIQRPKRYQDVTVRGLLEAYIENHNAQVDESKQFVVGMVTVEDSNDSIYCYTNMNSTMKEIKEDLVDDLGGYLRVRYADGVKYIDYLAEAMNTTAQTIEIGENLLDFSSNIDSSEIATAIIPLGAVLEERTVEGLDTRLTIESVNEGLDYVHSPEAVEAYGWIYKTVPFDGVTTPEALKRKGEQYLADIQFENMVIEAKAVDLHLTDAEIERFKLSDQIRVVSPPHGLNKLFRLTKFTINLNKPASNVITLGKDETVSLSAKSNQENEEIKKAIESIIPPSTVLNQAIANATALITAAMGGYVVKTQNELLIMDTDDIKTAQKVWRWNINGLGFSNTGYDGKYEIAMTMDGNFSADFISSGTMYADRIKGGTLNLGGQNNDNGVLSVRDSEGKEVGRWDKDGIVFPSNARIKWEQVTGTDDVPTKDDIPSKTSDLTNDSGYKTGEQITEITKNTVTTDFIKALNLTVGNEILMGEDARISWEQIEGAGDVVTSENVTEITKDAIATTIFSANQISGGTLNVGGANNEDGVIKVYDADGVQIGVWDKDGLQIDKGKIKGVQIEGSTLTSQADDSSYIKIENGAIIGGKGEDVFTRIFAGNKEGYETVSIDSEMTFLTGELMVMKDASFIEGVEILKTSSYKAYEIVNTDMLSSQLSSYAKSTDLMNYVTSSDLTTKLLSYVTELAVDKKLGDYVKKPYSTYTGTISFVKSLTMIGSTPIVSSGTISVTNGVITSVY